MAENRNRTARRFLRTGNGPTAAAPADTESFVLPPRSSATHRESLRNSALSSTLVPASSPALLPPPSVPASPVPSAIARSGCSSPTSVGHALIRCQRALLHLRRALPQVNQDLAFRSSRSQWDPLVMRRKRQHTVFALRFAVHRNPLAARADLHFLHHFPYPHFLACILPGHRIPAALPVHIRIPRHFAQLAIHMRIRRLSRQRLQAELLDIPAHHHLLMRCSVHALVRYTPNPLAHLRIQIAQAVGFAPLQATQEVPPHILHTRFHFPFRLCPVRPAQSRREPPVPREVHKHWVPDDLASLVRPQPHRLHAVVENLFRHAADLLERRFVQPQQRAQLLVQRCFRHHPAAVTQREGEAVQLLLLPGHLQRAQMSPIHLRLLARSRLEAPHRHDSCRAALRPQPVRQNRVTASIVTLAQFTQQHSRVPHSGAQPLFQIRLERIELARRC